MDVNAAQCANLRITYYDSGHTIYLNAQAPHALKADLPAFCRNASPVSMAPRMP